MVHTLLYRGCHGSALTLLCGVARALVIDDAVNILVALEGLKERGGAVNVKYRVGVYGPL